MKKTKWSELASAIPDVDEEDLDDLDAYVRPEITAEVADGGYLSWLYGSSTLRHQAWPPKFIGRKPVIMMDSIEPLFRKIRRPTYKEGREIKRDGDSDTADRTQMVREFRNLIVEEDGRFRFIRLPGLEADDLVALACWWYARPQSPVKVMGVDKDFLQLESNIDLKDKDNVQIDYSRFLARLPLALQGEFHSGWQVLLTLCSMGDKSDSIPRLLPPRNLGLPYLNEWLYNSSRNEAFVAAYQMMGEPFLDNLYDVILPDPELFGFTRQDVFALVVYGKWNANLLQRLPEVYRKEVRSWRIRPFRQSNP